MPAHKWVKSVILTPRCILNFRRINRLRIPFCCPTLEWHKGKGSHSLMCCSVLQLHLLVLWASPASVVQYLGVLSGELEMRALHREGRTSGPIRHVSTALSLTAAAAQVRGASDTLVALGEKTLSMLALDVAVNKYDYSLARVSLPINHGIAQPDTLNMFSFCFPSCSLLHKWQFKCFLDNFVTPNLIKFIQCHAHANTHTQRRLPWGIQDNLCSLSWGDPAGSCPECLCIKWPVLISFIGWLSFAAQKEDMASKNSSV